MSDALNELAEAIRAKRPQAVLSAAVSHGELTLAVPLAVLVDLAEFLKVDGACRFSTLVDITAVDYPTRPARYDLVYHFLSMYRNQRIRVRVAVAETDMVPSIIGPYPAANWFEREVFDMFGILFPATPICAAS